MTKETDLEAAKQLLADAGNKLGLAMILLARFGSQQSQTTVRAARRAVTVAEASLRNEHAPVAVESTETGVRRITTTLISKVRVA